MQDLTTVNDALMQSPKKKQRNNDQEQQQQQQQRWRTPKGQPGKGKGNNGKKGTGKQWQWPQHGNSPLSLPSLPKLPFQRSRRRHNTVANIQPDNLEHAATSLPGHTIPEQSAHQRQARQRRQGQQGSRPGQGHALGAARPRDRPWSRPDNTTILTQRPDRQGDGSKHSIKIKDLPAKATGSQQSIRRKDLTHVFTQQLTLVHLSFFDGIGAASLALRALDIHPVMTISWETDPECINVIEEHFQPTHMGDINDFDIEKLIDALLDNLNPDVPITILITGGPPCPDFSGIRANPHGTSGTTGHLFQKFVQIIQQIKQVLQQVPIYLLIENVVPHTNVQQDIVDLSGQLGIDPIIVDAEDGGIIHRKRLWWLSAKWGRVKTQLVANTPWDLQWTQTDTPWPRLRNPIAQTLQPTLDTKHFTAPAILQKGGLFHCLTTPAPDENGRPAPQHTNEKPDTIQRWQADHRRFAPWQYQKKYLVTDTDEHQHLAPAQMREQTMGFDGQHTANMTPDETEYRRNKALGNTWHVPSAIWLLLLLVMDIARAPATAIPISPIQRATSIWLATSTPFGPPPKPVKHLYMPQFSWREHMEWTQSLDTSHTPKPLDPTLEWVLQHSHLFHPLADFRTQVVLEIRQLVEDMQEETDKRLRDLPPHVQKAYTASKQVTQVPVFLLLRQVNYPQAELLHRELSSGFRLMGQLQPGTNWYLRSDNKYLTPKTQEEFVDHNNNYVQRKCRRPGSTTIMR